MKESRLNGRYLARAKYMHCQRNTLKYTPLQGYTRLHSGLQKCRTTMTARSLMCIYSSSLPLHVVPPSGTHTRWTKYSGMGQTGRKPCAVRRSGRCNVPPAEG